ncbi:MAG: VWA domain-containing protein [Planctomycetota bacterium]
MIAALLLASLVQGGLDPLAPPAAAVRLRGPAAAVEVGEPFELAIEAAHAPGAGGAELAAGEPVLDDSWVLLATRLEAGERATRRIFAIASLEAGEREIVVAGLAPGEGRPTTAERVPVSVAGVLGDGEDAPRPLRGFPAGFGAGEEEGRGSARTLVALGAGAVLGALAWRRRARSVRAALPRDPLVQLEDLRAAAAVAAADGGRTREQHFALTALLREAADLRLSRDRRGRTDAEWLAELAADPALAPAAREALAAALAACERVKYGGETPSPWALAATFEHARTALAALAGPAGGLPAVLAPLLLLAGPESAARGALPLGGGYSFADPAFLLLVPAALLALAAGRMRRGRARGRIPVLPAGLAPSLRQRLAWLPLAFQASALLLAIVALARPLRGNVSSVQVSEGVDIVCVVDRSSSMRFDDLEPGRRRLDVVKDVVGDFAGRRMTDREGAADRVALLTFAKYPQLLCPFTLDADALLALLEGVDIVKHIEEDMTAIGVALTKAVSLLETSDAKSRVVVLLTDGENNLNEIPPRAAGELAAEAGVRVYTIYAARYVYMHDPFRGYVPRPGEADTSELVGIAELTGGRFYRAKDRAGLEEVYAEIEALERTPREERRTEENYDLYPLFLLPAALFYAAAWLSSATWARRIT